MDGKCLTIIYNNLHYIRMNKKKFIKFLRMERKENVGGTLQKSISSLPTLIKFRWYRKKIRPLSKIRIVRNKRKHDSFSPLITSNETEKYPPIYH